MEGHYSSTTPYLNRTTHSKTRWRPEFSEYQCDDCHQSIRDVYPTEPINPEEGELEHVIDNDENEIEIEAAQVTSPVPEV